MLANELIFLFLILLISEAKSKKTYESLKQTGNFKSRLARTFNENEHADFGHGQFRYGRTKRALDSLEGSGFGLKRSLDSLEGSGFGMKKRALDSIEGGGFGGFSKRALDSLEGAGFGMRKRALDSLEGSGFGMKRSVYPFSSNAFGMNRQALESFDGESFGAYKRALDSLEGAGFGMKKRALDSLEGAGFGMKRALDSLEGEGFGGLQKRAPESFGIHPSRLRVHHISAQQRHPSRILPDEYLPW